MTKAHKFVDGRWETEGYDDAAHFSWAEVPIDSPRDLYDLIRRNQSEITQALIRGRAVEDLPSQGVRRKKKNFDETDHHWFMADLDLTFEQLATLEGALWNEVRMQLRRPKWHRRKWCRRLAEAAWRACMPGVFHDCSFTWAYSSSAGIKEKLALHFFFMWDRPVCGASIKEWLRNPLAFPYLSSPTALQPNRRIPLFDLATTHTVQIHYVAAPVFEIGSDPISNRIGFFQGSQDFLPTPAGVWDLFRHQAIKTKNEREKQAEKALQKRLRTEASPELLQLEERNTNLCYEKVLTKLRFVSGGPGTGSRMEMVGQTCQAAGLAKGCNIQENQFLHDIEDIWRTAGRSPGSGLDMGRWAWEVIDPISTGLARSSLFQAAKEEKEPTGPIYVPGAQLVVPPRDLILSGAGGITVADPGCLPKPGSRFYNPTGEPQIIDLPPEDRFIGEITVNPKTRLLIQEGTTGSGKTRAVLKMIADPQAPWKSVLVLAPLKALTESLQHRWLRGDDLEAEEKLPESFYYADGKGHIVDPHVICCINSLLRVTRTYDLIIIDETELCIQNLNSRRLMKDRMGPAYERLRELLKAAKLVIPLDAYEDEGTTGQLAKMGGVEPQTGLQRNHHEYIHPDTKLNVHPNKGALMEKIVRDVAWNRKKVFLGATHAKVPELLKTMILNRNPNARVLVINREAPPEARATLKNPNEEWQKYDAVLCSPTVGSGVSFDIPDYFDYNAVLADAVPGSFIDGGIGWNQPLQQSSRVRNPKSRTLEVWVSTREDDPGDKEELRAEEAKRAHATIGILAEYDPSLEVFEPSSKEHFNFFFESRWLNAQRRRHMGGDFLAYFASRGVPGNYEIFFDEEARKKALEIELSSGMTLLEKTRMTIAEGSTITREQRQEEAEQTAKAAVLSLVEAIELLEAPRALEIEERQSARRALIVDFLGRDPTTEDCHDFLFGCRKRELQNLAWTSFAQEGLLEVFELLDLAQINSGFQAHLSYLTLTALGLAKVWEVVCEEIPGLKKVMKLWSQGQKLTPKGLQKLLEGQLKLEGPKISRITNRIRELFAEDPALWEPVRRRLSLPRPNPKGEAPKMGAQAFVGRILRGVGFQTVGQQKQAGGGKKIRKYELDLESIRRAFDDTINYRGRMLDEHLARVPFAPMKNALCTGVPQPLYKTITGGLWDTPHHPAPQRDVVIPPFQGARQEKDLACSVEEEPLDPSQNSSAASFPSEVPEWFGEEACRLQFLGVPLPEIVEFLRKKGAEVTEDAVIEAWALASLEA